MSVSTQADEAHIILAEEGLVLLMAAVEKWLDGAEDFGISPAHADLPSRELRPLDRESLEIWFWGPTYSGP